jgi:hypothetical protein
MIFLLIGQPRALSARLMRHDAWFQIPVLSSPIRQQLVVNSHRQITHTAFQAVGLINQILHSINTYVNQICHLTSGLA